MVNSNMAFYIIESCVFLFKLHVIIPGFQQSDLQSSPSFHHQSDSTRSRQIENHSTTFCLSRRSEQPTKLNHCTKPPTANLREPMMMPPRTACCRGNSAASTSIALMSLVMAVRFHSQVKGLITILLTKCRIRVALVQNSWEQPEPKPTTCFLLEKALDRENLMKTMIPSG